MANIYFSAHQDDDLIFMNPNLMDEVASGNVWTVYMTAGGAGLDEDYWRGREEGERAAYTAMGSGKWREDSLIINNRRIASSVSSDGRVRLVFLRLPDGGRLTKGDEPCRALERIWQGERVETLDRSGFYNRETLDALLMRIIRLADAGTVSTHDPKGWLAGCDHIDHLYTDLFVLEAAARQDVETRLYQGYSCDLKPQNIPDAVYHRKRAIFEVYAHHDPMIPSPLDYLYENWLKRSYYARSTKQVINTG